MPAPPLWKDHRCFVCWALCTDFEAVPEYMPLYDGLHPPDTAPMIPTGWHTLTFEPCGHKIRVQFNTVQVLMVHALLDAMQAGNLC